jgi:two-component system response regulator BaeR
MTTKGHVVLVEDEPAIANILNDYLRKSGFRITCIGHGGEAVDAVKNDPPDVVLLDIMLPGKDGMSICREIRTFSNVPIIMVTARVEEIDKLLGLELGADDYVCKPFSPREVVARVKAQFRRAGFAANPQNKPPLIEVEEPKARILIKGQALDLTPTEFRIFKLLLSQPSRVYSRAQLLEHCYQQDQAIVDRAIDSHVKNLRKKIAKVLPGQELIHAVYGMGYRFEEQS